jgi:type III secretion system HrpB7-like protein
MKDRRIVALERVLGRRRRLDRTLNATLVALRGEHNALQEMQCERQRVAQEKADELDRHDERIDAMTSGAAPFRADEYLRLNEFRGVISERCTALQNEAVQAAAQVAQKQAEVDHSRGEVLRNRARVDIYDDRCKDLYKARTVAEEEQQDEEVLESRRVPARAF